MLIILVRACFETKSQNHCLYLNIKIRMRN